MDQHTNNLDTKLDLSSLDCHLNEMYEITTNYGTVQGNVVSVGRDYIELIEANMTTVIVPYENIISISQV